MIQPQTQSRQYWEKKFTITPEDIDHLYTRFLETQQPQPTSVLVEEVMQRRVTADLNAIKRRLSGRAIYQPKDSFEIGQELVFPGQDFSFGQVTGIRDGYNPEAGTFQVITVEMEGKDRLYAAGLETYHDANVGDGGIEQFISFLDADDVYQRFGHLVEEKLLEALDAREDFVYLGGEWFARSLLYEINIGHLHLAEAVLEMLGGGPTRTAEIAPHLDLDKEVPDGIKRFSLNEAMLRDGRFDEVAPKRDVAWFLRRMEPEAVQNPPARLDYTPVPYDKSILTTSQLQIEREAADEWSEYTVTYPPSSLRFSLIYPHRLNGSLPLNAHLEAMLPLGRSPRQLFTARDAETGQEMQLWAVKEARMLVGLSEWYEENGVPVGGYITIRTSDDPNVVLIDCHRRRPQSEDVRLATVEEGRIDFKLERRRIGCSYDDLMIVGTDFTAAIDGLWNRLQREERTLESVIALMLPELAGLTMQNAVHVKTIYSAVNMVYRVPPGPLMAALVRNPAFQPVGDHYWMFEKSRWRSK